MYKFIEEMKKNKTICDFRVMNKVYKVYNHINFDLDCSISIQASFGSYCVPRETKDLELYKSMEVAFIKNGNFVRASKFLSQKLVDKIENFRYGDIYAYVPCELIEEIYLYLMENFRYKKFNKHNGSKI